MEIPLNEGFPVAPISRLGIREAATHVRRVLALPDGKIDMPKLLDRLTEYGIHYDVFDDRGAPVPREVEACWVPEERTIYVRDSVYEQMCTGGRRAVFTLGHELGHAVLAHRRTMNRQRVADMPIYCNSEWQANRFAAEFTMPIDAIVAKQLHSPGEISDFFGVSAAAADVRIKDLNRKGEIGKKP